MNDKTHNSSDRKIERDKQKAHNMREILIRNVSVQQANKMAFVNMLFAFMVLVSVVFVAVDVKNRVAPPVHIPVDADLRYEQPVSKRVHNKSDGEVATYTANVLTSMFSYDWFNASNQLNKQVQYFTNEGWLGFKDNLEVSGELSYVRDNRYISALQIIDTPVVLNKGITTLRNGDTVAFWTVRVDAIQNYIYPDTGNTGRTEQVELTVRIVRVSSLERQDGIAINSIIKKNKVS